MWTPHCFSLLVEPLLSVAVEPGLQRLLENPFAAHLLHVRVDYGIHSSWNIIWLVSVNLGSCGTLRWFCEEHDVTFHRSLPRWKLSSFYPVCAQRSHDGRFLWRRGTNSPVGHHVSPQQKQVANRRATLYKTVVSNEELIPFAAQIIY